MINIEINIIMQVLPVLNVHRILYLEDFITVKSKLI